MKNNLNNSWLEIIKNEFNKQYIKDLENYLIDQKKLGKTILPRTSLWFNALNSTPFNSIKVVIIGQDPYPNIGHAMGLSFSISSGITPLPKSLKNINIELMKDLGIDNSHTGNLRKWANQGVLLLNSILTVEEHRSNSHKNIGWEIFTEHILELINKNRSNVVFILWGKYAQQRARNIDATKHLIIKSPHPSPLSAYRGFFGSKPFSQTNNYLISKNIKPINWQL